MSSAPAIVALAAGAVKRVSQPGSATIVWQNGPSERKFMGWRRIRDKILPPKIESPAASPVPAQPLHVSSQRHGPRPGDRSVEARLVELRRRRDALFYDIEQGILAQQPENPWQDRVNLLTEAMATVEDDLTAVDVRPVVRRPQVEPLPIDAITAGGNELIRVEFSIAGNNSRSRNRPIGTNAAARRFAAICSRWPGMSHGSSRQSSTWTTASH